MTINDIEIEQLTWQFFRKHLKIQGRNYHWLADNMGYGYDYTYGLLNNRYPLNENHKRLLIELLEIPVVSKTSESSTAQTA